MSDGRKRVLVVDDEPAIRDSLRLLLKGNFEVKSAEDGREALGIVEEWKPDLVLMDVMMPNLDGIETLEELRRRDVDTPVVMLTATNTVKTAVLAMKHGAVDYLSKPFEIEELTTLIVDTLEKRGAPAQAPASPRAGPVRGGRGSASAPDADFGPMVGRSPEMADLFRTVRQVAERDTTVLVTGESGTGKELVARRIHELSSRRDNEFVALNCAAIPETLIESELFGHEKGAFTNAVEKRLGLCELADKGTLFLDEIGELSLAVQVKLLRFLQEQEFHRVGRSKPVKVDVRILAATNRPLEEMIREKRFRQDLYYRINVINLAIPPLRDRHDDIPYLVRSFVDRLSPLYGGRRLEMTDEAMETLVRYRWPGNVRELENVVESLMALSPEDAVSVDLLPRKVKDSGADPGRADLFNGNVKFEDAERIFESEMIVKALRKTNYVQTRAAELLGISRRILKYKMDKLGISDRPDDGRPRGASPDGAPEAAPFGDLPDGGGPGRGFGPGGDL